MTIDIPARWQELDLKALTGPLVIVGGPDVGKTTLAQYLYRRLQSQGKKIAYLDGDPGQSQLGPPTTITLALGNKDDDSFPPGGRRWRSFVGEVTPRGHMLPLLVGVARLMAAAEEAGATAIVYDTTGLIEPERGGLALKLAILNLLRRSTLLALQQKDELEPLLRPLRRSQRVQLIELPPSSQTRRRDVSARQAHRAEKFAAYFESTQSLSIFWPKLAVLPAPNFALNQLVALEDVDGFTLGLGFVTENDVPARRVKLQTPVTSLDQVDGLRLGDRLLDPETFGDKRLE